MRALPRLLLISAIVAVTPRRVGADGAAGWTRELRLSRSAHSVPTGAPNVIVHAPPHFDPARPLWLVLFLHGWRGCARVLMESGEERCQQGAPLEAGWALGDQHDRAGTNSLFIIPQLAFDQRDGSPGRFSQAGYARAWLEELLEGALSSSLGETKGLSDVGRITLVAHSAGYETALSLLRAGELPEVKDVALMDALYGGARPFADWMMGGADRTLWSTYTSRGGDVDRETSRLYRLVGRRDIAFPRAILRSGWTPADVHGKRLLVMRSHARHRDVPSRHLAETLAALRGI